MNNEFEAVAAAFAVVYMPIIDIVLLALATDACLNLWFKGDIFKDRREQLQRAGGRLGKLVSCPLCLSCYIVMFLSLTTLLPAYLLPRYLAGICRLPLISLAAITIVYFLQGADEDTSNDDETRS